MLTPHLVCTAHLYGRETTSGQEDLHTYHWVVLITMSMSSPASLGRLLNKPVSLLTLNLSSQYTSPFVPCYHKRQTKLFSHVLHETYCMCVYNLVVRKSVNSLCMYGAEAQYMQYLSKSHVYFTTNTLKLICVILRGRIKDAARSLSKINHSCALTHPRTVL